jgi:hypothetical protein
MLLVITQHGKIQKHKHAQGGRFGEENADHLSVQIKCSEMEIKKLSGKDLLRDNLWHPPKN